MADSILEQLLGQLGGGVTQRASRTLGADEKATREGLGAAVPVLLAALQRNAEQPGGAEAIDRALERDHDGGVLEDVEGWVEAPNRGEGAGILRHVLGGRRPRVEQGLARSTGLDAEKVGALLEMAAPLVMGALGKEKRQRELGSEGLTSLLGREREAVQREQPQAADLLTTLLDQDGDGSVLDDVGRIGKGLFDRYRAGR